MSGPVELFDTHTSAALDILASLPAGIDPRGDVVLGIEKAKIHAALALGAAVERIGDILEDRLAMEVQEAMAGSNDEGPCVHPAAVLVRESRLIAGERVAVMACGSCGEVVYS